MSSKPGTTVDLRYEYVDQDQPRTGRKQLSVGEIPHHHDEVRTLNRNLIATIDYTQDSDNGISIQLPFVKRDHEHIHNHHGAKLDESWHFDGIGDMRVVGRHRFAGEQAVAHGILFGVKLPTGSTDKTDTSNAVAERSLQPGSGTTDLILGAFAGMLELLGETPTRLFAQAQVQAPVNQSDGYRPGNKYSADIGIVYPADAPVSGMLQLNLSVKDRDRGPEGEPADSGGSFVWLSPGVSYAVSRETQIYGFLQLPLYQHVNGVQLTANWTLAAGVHWRF